MTYNSDLPLVRYELWLMAYCRKPLRHAYCLGTFVSRLYIISKNIYT